MTVDINSLNELPLVYNQQYTKEVADSIERIDTGLKINDTADDTAAAIISISLRSNASALAQGIQNANTGYGLIEVSNKALDYQEEILTKIKEQLTLANNDESIDLDSIRENVQSLIEEFDNIASSTSYNSNYTLQQSSSDTSTSQQISINFTTDTSVTTPAVRSNSEGVNLDTLKNFASGELTESELTTQLENVETALETVASYKEDFALTKEELAINIDNLTTIEEGNKASELNLTQANIVNEEIVFDKYKLLVENSSFALAQANITQEAVLSLLTNIPDYEPVSVDDSLTTNDDKDDIFTGKEDNTFEYKGNDNIPSFNNDTYSPSSSATATSSNKVTAE